MHRAELRKHFQESLSFNDLEIARELVDGGEERELLWSLVGVSLKSGENERIKDVHLNIREGITAILGLSGAGKTTLLNILVGFEESTEGIIHCHVNSSSERLGLFWSPQGDGLWPHLNVMQHLRAVSGERFDQDSAIEMLEAFGLQNMQKKRPDIMSSGERERLSVCRALYSKAKVLILDEPLANVDSCRSPDYWDYIQDYINANEMSIVMSTHARETAAAIAEHAICIADGKIAFDGRIRDLYDRPPNIETAKLIGPCNVFSVEEAASFLNIPVENEILVRPERLVLVPGDPEKDLHIEKTRSRIPYTEATLANSRGGALKKVICMSRGLKPREGIAAALRLLGCIVMCFLPFLISGCGEDDGKLDFQKVEIWKVPNEGSSLPAPRSVYATRDGTLYAVDMIGRILVYSEEGEIVKKWSMPDVRKGRPEGIVVKRSGDVIVCDTHYNQIIIFDPEGNIKKIFGTYGKDSGQFIYPVAITLDAEENIYIAEYGSNDRIQKFTPEGEFIATFGSFGTAPEQFQRPSGLVWRDGLLYVADAINNCIKVYTDKGGYVGVLGEDKKVPSLDFPYDIAMVGDKLFIIEYGAGRITCTDFDGKVLGRFGSTGMGKENFSTPWGITASSEGVVFVADTGNRRIVRLAQ